MNSVLNTLAEVVSESESLEELVRPLLELLESVTGLESTYLTTIDLERNVQRILFSRNTRELNIPEKLEVEWNDTLCKRALDEGRAYTDDVGACWGDSNAARELGIATYLSEPVRVGQDELYGTLCAASSRQLKLKEDAHILLPMFAKLIARQVERERLLARMQLENREYSKFALTDPLTGIPNRRALVQELNRALANGRRTNAALHVAFLDLNGFKYINDTYGHDAGDRFLMAIAKTLSDGLREGDFIARYGGDEFVIFGPSCSEDSEASRKVIRERLEKLTTGKFDIGTMTIDYAGASVGVVTTTGTETNCDEVLTRADAVMYEVKKARK